MLEKAVHIKGVADLSQRSEYELNKSDVLGIGK